MRAQAPPEGPAPLQLSGAETELSRVEAVVLDKAGRPVRAWPPPTFAFSRTVNLKTSGIG